MEKQQGLDFWEHISNFKQITSQCIWRKILSCPSASVSLIIVCKPLGASLDRISLESMHVITTIHLQNRLTPFATLVTLTVLQEKSCNENLMIVSSIWKSKRECILKTVYFEESSIHPRLHSFPCPSFGPKGDGSKLCWGCPWCRHGGVEAADSQKGNCWRAQDTLSTSNTPDTLRSHCYLHLLFL